MAKTIVFGNMKGGVAKTTSTFNIATQLSLQGYRVLMVDSDPQASLTCITLKYPEDYIGRNLPALLYDRERKVDIHDCIVSLNHILPKFHGLLSPFTFATVLLNLSLQLA